MASPARVFRSGSIALVRAAAHPRLHVPPWPDLIDSSLQGVSAQVAWLRAVWDTADVTDAVRHASPALAQEIQTLCMAERPAGRDVRRAVLSVARYLLRAEGRATPFGLFAGVTTAALGTRARAEWGTEHRTVVRAGAEWLAAVIGRLEACPVLLARLPVVANSALMVRGDRVVVPYQPDGRVRGTGAVEVALRHSEPVRAALAAARTPAPVVEVREKVLANFPDAGQETVTELLAELVKRRVLITSLHAPGTATDAFGHLLAQLDAVGADGITQVSELVRELRDIDVALEACDGRPVRESRAGRERAAELMGALAPVRRHPLAVDLRLDASVTLPAVVAREVEKAALVLARVSSAPYGTAAWKAYHQRFYERFGIGSMVPVLDAVADSGIGFPDGYPGTAVPERRPPVSSRDEVLVRLAQQAVLDGREEVVVDEALLAALDLGPEHPRLPPHVEIGVRVHADSTASMERGDFRLEVLSVSRGAGVGTGRFLPVLDQQGRTALAGELSDLPGGDGTTAVAQLSFPPLVPQTAHVTRAPRVLPTVISLEEHQSPDASVLTVEDLAVGCDGRRMYLAAPAYRRRVEAVAMHALNLRTHTSPLARFLIELSRAQCAAVTLFDWGAAQAMPFLPRLCHGRTVISPARWRLTADELPDRISPWSTWDDAFTGLRSRRRLPRHVHLAEGDRRLTLDLDHTGHRVLLRDHLHRSGQAVLVEAPGRAGWCGGRAHEIVIPLRAVGPSPWPRLPAPTRDRIIGRDQGQSPAASPVLLAALYGDIRRQDTVVAEHLPALLERLGQPPWWYVRFRDPDQHLRLRIALNDPADFGPVAAEVSAWTNELHAAGLLREVRYPTSYPETGRWGSGQAWQAAEEVFRTDSRALLTQLRQRDRPERRALVAAHTVAIASAFLGSTAAGMRWLIDHIPATAPQPVPRPQFTEAVRLADPRHDWSALRSLPGGPQTVAAWADRDTALAAYRSHLPGPDTHGINADDVLNSLLHVHFVRHVAVDFPEEALCLYLARAAALTWTARTTGRPA
ncbi:lantibiotic dehydratase [Actinacidiphila sp. bgisy167]|uniref:lantibiotic dehydratase n=1 Tax=Actinacidiphila sp. bgisy167 TaxID=3413797 RepID=UPI003D70A588